MAVHSQLGHVLLEAYRLTSYQDPKRLLPCLAGALARPPLRLPRRDSGSGAAVGDAWREPPVGMAELLGLAIGRRGARGLKELVEVESAIPLSVDASDLEGRRHVT